MAASSERLILLHLSDIHFVKGKSGDQYDIDKPLRDELERDAEVEAAKFGGVAAILVTGDIAYAAREAEYVVAADWLKRIAKVTECSPGRIWTVPGNHDVDRDVVESSPKLRTIHKYFKTTITPDDIHEELAKYLRHDDGKDLFKPLEQYNKFAIGLGCDLSPDKPYWHHKLTLNDDSTLRIVGLNSSIVSSKADVEGNVILGGEQVAHMTRGKGVQYLALCHHPVEWFRTRDQLQREFMRRPRISLFGHKHMQTIYQIEETVRITAGAVHPERREPNWLPRYNFVTVAMVQRCDMRQVEVVIYPRIWNGESMRFEEEHFEGRAYRRYYLELPDDGEPVTVVERPEPPSVVEQTITLAQDRNAEKIVDTGKPAMTREARLATRFTSLPYHRRIAVAEKLGLLDKGDETLTEVKRFQLVFRRATERNRLADLWDAIDHESGLPSGENPFRGQD